MLYNSTSGVEIPASNSQYSRFSRIIYQVKLPNYLRLEPVICFDFLQIILFGNRGAVLKLLFIIGDAAVGKMTVGQELTKITGLRLFHNHMTIEPVMEIFGYFNGNVISRIREIIFEEFAKSEQYGLIFTYMWAFDQQSDWDYADHVCDIFRKQNSDIFFV